MHIGHAHTNIATISEVKNILRDKADHVDN